jgi:hypothetical protein
MIGIFGVADTFPSFSKDSLWLFKPEVKKLAWRHPAPGYRLINFTGRIWFCSLSDRKDGIESNHEITDEVVFTEAAFTLFKMKGVKVAKDWYHCGSNLFQHRSHDSHGTIHTRNDFICVGCDRLGHGWDVFSRWAGEDGNSQSSFRTTFSRSFIKR